LTIQELGLILRSQIMGAFASTQPGVQSILPILPSSSSDPQFLPFIAGVGTVFLAGASQMLLPITIVENIRALTHRAHVQKFPNGNVAIKHFIPILGQIFGEGLNSADYNVTVQTQEGPVMYPVFASSATLFTTTNEKNETVALAEVPIDLVDGSSSGSFVAINDPMRLSQLVDLHNVWVKTLQAFTCKVGVVGTDAGVNILSSIQNTKMFTDLLPDKGGVAIRQGGGTSSISSIEAKPQKRRSGKVQKPYIDARMVKRSLHVSPFVNRSLIVVTQHDPALAAVWTTVHNFWIFPSVRLLPANFNNATSWQRMASTWEEPHSIVVSNENTIPPTFAQYHLIYAQKMVKARNGDEIELDQFIDECTKAGHAGILSSLAAGFLRTVGGPTVGAIADSVASVLPF